MNDSRFYEFINKDDLHMLKYEKQNYKYASCEVWENKGTVMLLDKIKDHENVFKIFMQYKKD